MSHLVVRKTETFNFKDFFARIYLHILPGNFTFKPGRLLLTDLHIMEGLGELDMRGCENRIRDFHQPGVKSHTAYEDQAVRSI